MASPSQIASTSTPTKLLKTDGASRFLEDVRAKFPGNTEKYHEIVKLMNDYKDRRVDVTVAVARGREMLRGHGDLIRAFNAFLRAEHETNLHGEEKPLDLHDAHHFLNRIKVQANAQVYEKFEQYLIMFSKQSINKKELTLKVKELFKGRNDLIREFNAFLPKEFEINLEFEDAISFVTKVKDRFRNDERVYKEFLDVLNMHRDGNKSLEEVLRDVRKLFRGHDDLIQELLHFLPSGTT